MQFSKKSPIIILKAQLATAPKLKSRKFWGSGLWSRGAYYASVGHITKESVRKYIETQKTRN